LEQLKHREHRGGRADQPPEATHLSRLFTQKLVFETEARKIQRAPDHHLERIVIEGLLQIIYGAQLHRLHRRCHSAVRGQHDHGHFLVDLAQFPQELDPVLARHL
jgi:hypothetical protein